MAKLLARNPVADAHRLAGELDEKLGDPLAAVQEYERAARLDPSEQNYFAWGSELLLHRAVNEGEMSLAQANKEKRKVKLTSGSPIDETVLKGLPSRLRDLILRSNRLQEKVRRLDATIHAPPAADSIASPVNSQITQLRAAFERSQT